MMDERMDLTALEPDEGQRELLVAAIMSHADAELTRRAAADVSPIGMLYEWTRPALAAAAIVALVCVSVLARPGTHIEPGAGLTDALDVPTPVNEWLISDRSPTVADLLIAMEGDAR